MAKTTFNDGNASLGILGTRVLSCWLNKVFAHRHTGEDNDGYAPQIALDELEASVVARLMPAGSVIHTAASAAPAGYLKANGAAVSRVTYSTLFAAIGTTWGAGDGSTTFNLPDLRGEFIRGYDDGRGVDAGRVLGTSQVDALESHVHDCLVFDDTATIGAAVTSGSAQRRAVTGTTGSTGTTETRPRNIALLACIKY